MKPPTANYQSSRRLAGGGKTLALLSAACALLIGTMTVQAQLTAYESFNYPTGAFANGTTSTGTGFTSNWSLSGSATIIGGLTYPSLPTGNNAFQQSPAGQRDSVSLSTPLSSGTVYISFLYNQAGNNGGNVNGLYLPGSGATSLYVGLTAPWSGTAGNLGLGTVTTSSGTATGLSGVLAQMPGPTQLFNYNQTHLIVVRIDFNTSGANDTVSLWLDPTAGVTAPAGNINAPNPDLVVNNYDVGTISGIGFNFQGGGAVEQYDEIRVGTSYGSVVGASAGATIPTTLSLSVSTGNEVSWTANNTDSYQPQSSSDNVNWNNLGSVLTGSAVTSVYDPAPVAFYRVLDYTLGGPSTNQILNGSFEIPAGNSIGAINWTGSPNDAFDSVWVTNSYGALVPHSGSSLLYMEGTTATNTPAAPNTYTIADQFPVTGGLPYTVSFYAANPVQVGGANPQYFVQFFDSSHAFISQQVPSFASAGSTWTLFGTTITAPANAAFMGVQFIQAIGAGPGWDWVSLIDDVSVTYPTTGPTNVLTATVQAGAVFTAAIQTNGVTATAATGSVAFQTNSVAQSTGLVGSGIANSTPAIVPNSYTVTAIYTGDGTYIGSTNSLVVSGGPNTTPTNITSSTTGNQLKLSWPFDHTGWKLQAQTNSLSTGLTSTWYDVPGSITTNQMVFTINPANPSVFFRLKYP